MPREARYEIQVSRRLLTYRGKGPVEVGRVIDLDNSREVVAYIVYENHELSPSPYHVYGRYAETDAGTVFAIMIDDNYRRLFREKEKQFKAIVLHELGHHVCGHYEDEYWQQFFSEEQRQGDMTELIRLERVRRVERGSVMPNELEADAFACREVGKHTMNMMLDLLIEERRKRADGGAGLAIREFQLRKKAIRYLQ